MTHSGTDMCTAPSPLTDEIPQSQGLVNPPDRRESLTGDVAFLFAAKVTAYVLNYAVPLILVRRLSQTEFGLYKQFFLLAATITALGPLSFHMSAYYFLPRVGILRPRVVFNILLVN